jgi:hypothetical protein
MIRHNSQLCTIRLNDYNTLFHFKIKSYILFWALVFKDYRLYHKPISIVVLNALGGKFLISGITSTYLFKTYDLIFDFFLSQHKFNLNYNVFSLNIFFVVIGVVYC